MSPREREPDPKRESEPTQEPKPNPESDPNPWPEPKLTPVRSLAGAVAESENTVFLGPRDSLHGRLEVHGDLRVAGSVEGDLKAGGDVVVEPTASILGLVEGVNVSVRGQINGNVIARGQLSVGGAGVLNGDIKVRRLRIEDGATLNGHVTMSGVNED